MRITYRTILILLCITILMMAYCTTTVDGAVLRRTHPHRHGHSGRPVVTKYKIKHKTKTKTKITYGKKPGLIKKITGRG